MKHGSLSAMNKDVDAKKLQIGQDIKTTLNKSDLPEGTQPHSDNSLKGMDGFFKKGADGVNNMVTISEEAYDAIVTSTANTYKSAFENTGKDNWSDNATGGFLDMKKYFLTNMSQYADENTRSDFFKNQTSVTELSARNLYLYKGYAYNINEFGNLMFGSVKAKLGANVRTLIAGGHVYSLFSNGSFDDAKEVEAVKRGFSYYEKK